MYTLLRLSASCRDIRSNPIKLDRSRCALAPLADGVDAGESYIESDEALGFGKFVQLIVYNNYNCYCFHIQGHMRGGGMSRGVST